MTRRFPLITSNEIAEIFNMPLAKLESAKGRDTIERICNGYSEYSIPCLIEFIFGGAFHNMAPNFDWGKSIMRKLGLEPCLISSNGEDYYSGLYNSLFPYILLDNRANMMVLLHEIAHHYTWTKYGDISHGAQFCRALMQVIRTAQNDLATGYY